MTERKTGADAVRALRTVDADEALSKDLQAAVSDGLVAPAARFNSHSQSFAGRLIAEQRSLKEAVATIDEQIARLNDQRTDAMLAQSGITAALNALERGKDS